MHPDLESVIAADEECRSRLTLAESRRDRDIAAARAKRDATIDRRRADAVAALERELAAIRAEGDKRLGDLGEQQKTYLAKLAAIGDERFAEAVKKYLAIVCGAEER
jgi:DNA anti-recombination protein RmuC